MIEKTLIFIYLFEMKAWLNALLTQLPCLTSSVVQHIQESDRKYNYCLQFEILQTSGKTKACKMLHLLHFFFSLCVFLALQDKWIHIYVAEDSIKESVLLYYSYWCCHILLWFNGPLKNIFPISSKKSVRKR